MRPNFKLTGNFWFHEFFVSKSHPDEVRRILTELDDNQVQREHLKISLYLLCHLILQPLRDAIEKPVIITSGYRDTFLNGLVAKTTHSLHSDGIAADFVSDEPKTLSLMYSFIKSELPYGQLILYRANGVNRNIHVSLPALGHEKITTIKELSDGT